MNEKTFKAIVLGSAAIVGYVWSLCYANINDKITENTRNIKEKCAEMDTVIIENMGRNR